MAEALCVDSWSRQRQESNQQFYSKINEMRAWMGMPLVEVPSYETKKEKPDYLQSMRKACERAAEIVERMKRWQTRSESQNFPEATQDSGVDPAPSTQEPDSNLGANSEEQNCEMVYSAADLEADEGREIEDSGSLNQATSSNLGANSESFESPDLQPVVVDEVATVKKEVNGKEQEPTPICLEVDETNLGLVYIEILETPSSMQEIVGVSQEKENEQLGQIDDLRKSKMRALEVLDFDYNKLEELEPHTSSDKKSGRLEVDKESSLNAYNLFAEMPRKKSVVFEPSKVNFDPFPVVSEIDFVKMDVVLLADAIEYLEFSYAHKVLEKMSKDDIAFMESSFHYSLRSIDSPSGFVFDPWKIIDMLLVLLWTIMSKCGPWLSLLFSCAEILG